MENQTAVTTFIDNAISVLEEITHPTEKIEQLKTHLQEERDLAQMDESSVQTAIPPRASSTPPPSTSSKALERVKLQVEKSREKENQASRDFANRSTPEEKHLAAINLGLAVLERQDDEVALQRVQSPKDESGREKLLQKHEQEFQQVTDLTKDTLTTPPQPAFSSTPPPSVSPSTSSSSSTLSPNIRSEQLPTDKEALEKLIQQQKALAHSRSHDSQRLSQPSSAAPASPTTASKNLFGLSAKQQWAAGGTVIAVVVILATVLGIWSWHDKKQKERERLRELRKKAVAQAPQRAPVEQPAPTTP